ncbi:MAG: XTP/dITP diphosphatase [Candidatus Helarchaeota archaeon]|nr:XTP/dITP diphosphatase [Candidatus Helarchaeota archaeon]
MKIFFVSSNIHKFQEIQKILNKYNVQISFHQAELPELQADSLEAIAHFSAKHAFSQLQQPLFVEDTGLFIDSLKGFPGPFASYVFKTIGNPGILHLLKGQSNRYATFRTVIALFISESESTTFLGETKGTIASSERGEHGWGYDPIFIPLHSDGKTYAEMSIEEKNEISHRSKSVRKLAEWLGSKLLRD